MPELSAAIGSALTHQLARGVVAELTSATHVARSHRISRNASGTRNT